MAKIRNIGKVSQQWLAEIGIYTIQDLERTGSVIVFELVRSHHAKVSLNLLWALEAAILDMDWRDLPAANKAALQRQLH